MWMIPRFADHGVPYDFLVLTRYNFKSIERLDRLFHDLSTSRFDLKHAGLFPSTLPMNSQIVINDEVQNYIMNGKIKIYGRLVRLGPREAEFDDGSVVHDLDAVLFATGYRLSMDFLDEDIVDESGKLSLYKMVFPLQLPHATLALIGYQDVLGTNTPIIELQARLAARIFAGKLHLPTLDVMINDVDKRNEELLQAYGRYKYWMAMYPFRDELAEELGVAPSWLDLIKAGPWLAYNYMYGPTFPYQDRLWGPHSWGGARKAIEEALEHGYYAKQLRQSYPPKLPIYFSKWVLVMFVGVAIAMITLYVQN